MRKTIAFIGLGIMGRPMALNLLRAGYTLYIYARRPEAGQALISAGAQACANAAQAASQAQVCITMVSQTADVESLLNAKDGIAAGLNSGSLWIDMSTIHPQASARMAKQMRQQGVAMLDAPVSGGEQGAIDGTLSIMAGGRRQDFDEALEILQCLGKNINYIGKHGAGQTAKACNQLLVAQTIAALAEAYALARANGVDARAVRAALLGGFAYSRMLEVHGLRILEDNYQPGFKAQLHLKDLNIVHDSAHSRGLTLAGSEMARAYLQALVEQGGGELDSSALAKIVTKKTGLKI